MTRKEIHDQVCDEGFNITKGSFTQYYGSQELDASLLMIPLVGFLPAHDPRVRGTIEAIERELVEGGFVLRYRTDDSGNVDGLSGKEGSFLACSFWLADCLAMLGRTHDARQLLDRLLGLRNDLGLLSEEYDAVAGRLVGNFPQAFSHVSLVNSASKLAGEEKPTSSHVILGLARRALTQGQGQRGTRHMGDVSAHGMLSKLAETVSGDAPGGAARAIKAAVGAEGIGTTGAPGDTGGSRPQRGRPTTAPSAKGAARLVANAPLRAAAANGAKKAGAKRAAAKKAGAKKAGGKKAGAKKAGAKKAGAKKAAPTKAATTKRKAPVKKGALAKKKAPVKKASVKKASADDR